MKITRCLHRALLTAIALTTAACASSSHVRFTDSELQSLLDAYKAQNAAVEAARAARTAEGIRTLDVTGRGVTATVTADLSQADLQAVVSRMLDGAGASFAAERPLHGRVTSRFASLPLVDALNVVLALRGFRAEAADGIVTIREGARPAETSAAATPPAQPSPAVPSGPPPSVRVEIPLQWLDTGTAMTMLATLFPSSSEGTPPVVQFAIQPNTNVIYLVGPAVAVQRTAAILRDADREPSHVLLEALVVEFDRDALQSIGVDLVNGAYGKLSGVNFNFGSLLQDAITFTRTGNAHNTQAFTLLVDLLEERNKARLVSRPYVATLSGVAANINITRNRYVIVQAAQAGATVVTPQAVPSGVTLSITPTVTADQRVRVAASVTDSQFIPTAGNVAVEVDQNQATTTMLVDDGESIVIGGMVLDRRGQADAGVPLLGSLPLIGYLFNDRSTMRSQQEVMIVITPHIWRPGMQTPLASPSTFSIR